MNYRAKAELLVQVGAARNYYDACSLLARRKRKSAKKETQPRTWLPYADD